MKITKAEWNRYKNTMSQLSDKASKEFSDWANQNGGWDNVDRQLMAEVAWSIASKYSEGSSALAAEMYDAIAQAEKVNVPPAEMAADVDFGELAKAINGALKHSDNDDFVSSPVGRSVKQAGADTMLKNASRDRAEFAWIPSGDSCAFCLVLASKGWTRASKKTTNGDHASHIHTHCDCQFAIRFNPKTQVEGYNPEVYLEMYRNAEGDTSEQKIKSMRKALGENINRFHQKTGEMPTEEYVRAKELWNTVKELDLPRKEREYIYEQFDEWLTKEEKQSAIVSRPIANHYYQAVNLGHNQYKIYKKVPIEPYRDIVDEVLSELFGENWRDI